MDKLYILFFLLVLPGFISIIRFVLQSLYLWQTKEYRLDRMISYMRFENRFLKWNNSIWLLKIILLALGILYLIYPNIRFLAVSYIIAFILYFTQLESFVKELFSRKLIRPRIRSMRNIIIVIFIVVFLLLIYGRLLWWFSQFDYSALGYEGTPTFNLSDVIEEFSPVLQEEGRVLSLLSLTVGLSTLTTLLLDIAMPVWILFMVIMTEPLSYLLRSRLINTARKIMLERADSLQVVAITGSYGKTTTKELIYEILSRKYKVAKTPENKNTSIGVAQSILNYVKPDTEVFIVEMGAYKKGEIAESTKIAKPDIAVVTALTNQHLSLFGSQENLYRTKFELVEGLDENGTAVFNGNDERCVAMAAETTKKKVFFYTLPFTKPVSDNAATAQVNSIDNNENLYVRKVEDIGEFLEIEFVYQGRTYATKVALKDARLALNLSAAMVVALQLGMNMEEIIKIIESWSYTSDYLSEKKGINDSGIILDTRSSNLEGFRLALRYLQKKGSGVKWVMTQGIIELGQERGKTYDSLAESIIETSDGLITTDESLITAVRKNKTDFKLILVNNSLNLVSTYKFNVRPGDTVLVEGAFPENVLDQLIVDD